MQENFQIKDRRNYFLRNQRDFDIPTVKSVKFDLESIRFLGPKIRENLLNKMENKESIESIKWVLRNGKQYHVLVVSVKHICRTETPFIKKTKCG